MNITLFETHLTKKDRLDEIDRQLSALEEKLKTPERTVEDIILHIKLIKERNSLS